MLVVDHTLLVKFARYLYKPGVSKPVQAVVIIGRDSTVVDMERLTLPR